jgi:hypothetical protein
MYAHDANDRIVYASAASDFPGAPPDPATDPYAWVRGTLDFDPSNPSNWNVEQDITKSPLWPYCGNSAGIWKCPADKSTVVPASGPFKGQRVPRVRSISMLIWLGGFGGKLQLGGGLQSPPWRLYLGLNDLVDPGPTQTLLFWDEREDAINAGNFFVDMTGYPEKPASVQFWDMPASYHNRAGGLSFTDGHVQIKPWLDARTVPPVRKNSNWLNLAPYVKPSPNNSDLIWLQERATRRVDIQ